MLCVSRSAQLQTSRAQLAESRTQPTSIVSTGSRLSYSGSWIPQRSDSELPASPGTAADRPDQRSWDACMS